MSTSKLREVFISASAAPDSTLGWFLPASMMEQTIALPASKEHTAQAVVVAIESDARFSIRRIGDTSVIVLRGMEKISGVTIEPRAAPSPVFSKRVTFSKPIETDLGSFLDLLLHDMAMVPSSGNFDPSSVPGVWSVRLPDVSILDTLQLIGAASGARIRIDGEKVILTSP